MCVCVCVCERERERERRERGVSRRTHVQILANTINVELVDGVTSLGYSGVFRCVAHGADVLLELLRGDQVGHLGE